VAQSPFDPKRVQARSAVADGHFRVAKPLCRYLHLLFARQSHHLFSSRLLLPLAPMRVVKGVVELSCDPQVVQEHG
jgi:hypothetical protein